MLFLICFKKFIKFISFFFQEFEYKEGKRVGKAIYTWKDGAKEESQYDEKGVKNGPAKLLKPGGAVEEYTYSGGSR